MAEDRERDKKEKLMARTLIMGLILLLGLPLPLFAGQITDIRPGKKTQDEIEIIIEGDYGAYQGVGMRSPARFVIDLEGARLEEMVPRSIMVEGPVVSEIKAISSGNNVRVVLVCADSKRLFHCTMHDQEGKVIVKCWMPKETAEAPADASEPDSGDISSPVLPQKNLNEIFGWPKKEEGDREEKETKKLAKYTGEKITLDFYKTELHNVFRLFAELSGKNIIIDEQVKGELTLALKEVPWDSAMDLILELKDLTKEEKLGTIIIKPKPVKAAADKGELVVKKFSEEILQPARLMRKKKEDRQLAQDMIIEAHNLEATGETKEALALYKKAYELWKDNTDLIMKGAYLNYSMGHFASSYFLSGEALKLNPKNSEAALYGALSAARMGRTEDAGQLFELAIKARPEIPEAFFNYALFLRKQKDYAGAQAVYQRHEQAFGPSLDVQLAVAGLYEIQGKNDEACKKYGEIQKSGFHVDKKTERVVQKKIQTLCTQGED